VVVVEDEDESRADVNKPDLIGGGSYCHSNHDHVKIVTE
jgi:hypothetical protein